MAKLEKYRVEATEHEYAPSEVARVSGVSTTLQRDWRRRGVIQSRGSGWNKYTLEDVIRMTVMRAFTQSGISLATAEDVSRLAVLPVVDELANWDEVAVFTGDQLSSEQMNRIRLTYVRGASGEDQFTFVALPEKESDVYAARLRNLEDGERIMSDSGNFYGIVLDHIALAHRIAEYSPLPILRFHVEAIADG